MDKMFCFQCEQTAKGRGCTGKTGVCGKTEDVAKAQDRLIGALIRLAIVLDGRDVSAKFERIVVEGLFTTLTNVNFDEGTVMGRVADTMDALRSLGVSDAGDPYDMDLIWRADEDIRSLKSLILFGMKGMAAYAYHAMAWGRSDERIVLCLLKGLRAVAGMNDGAALLDIVMELGRVNLICMELLDQANTQACGTPRPTSVSLTVEKGPFIIVSGHDLADLDALLKQTEGRGINVYTHGEMLPAHGYPRLKAYSHLKGHFGTAWQNQQKEFADVPAPILFTTNCIMPVKDGYADRVFTTGVVRYPGMVHIGEERNFTPVIEAALRLGGYAEDRPMKGINGGDRVVTGFGHGAILASAGAVVDAVKSGAIRHFFLVGGCDGARASRSYYTEFVRRVPADCMVLTLACGKFRFNDMDLGTIGGLPRLLDLGQCNDAYGAVKVASALSDAFGCGINELPLTLVLSWYEQKAVCILLTLLSLDVRNILLGPSLPAFISSNVLRYLVDHFGVAAVGDPDEDLRRCLSR